MPVSTVVAGPLAERLGAPTTLPGMSALGVTAALAFLAVPQVRALPQGC